MRKLLFAFVLLLLPSIAMAQSQCVVPAGGPGTAVVSAAAEGSHVLKAAPGCLLSTYVTIGATAGYLMIFNSTTVPADGAVTPIECIPVAASSYTFLNFAPQPPEWFSTGISAAFSTTGCFTKTVGSGAFFHALVQ